MTDFSMRKDAWKKVERGDPYIAFEVQLRGNIHEALSKLKHAFDFWNSIPVLVTSRDQVGYADRLISGSFHEIRDVIRVIP